jgi:hypothetical protein
MITKGPPTFCNSLKITIREMLLKTFFMSTYGRSEIKIHVEYFTLL